MAVLCDRWAAEVDVKLPMIVLTILMAPLIGLFIASFCVSKHVHLILLSFAIASVVQGLNIVAIYFLSELDLMYVFPIIGATVIFCRLFQEELFVNVLTRSKR